MFMTTRLSFIILLLAFYSTNGNAQDYDFGKVSKAEIEQAVHAKEPEANAAILYREVKTKFNQSADKGFYTETDVFERIKIYNKDGFDYATKRIRLYQGKSNNSDDVQGLKAIIFTLEKGKIEKEKLKNSDVFEEKMSEYIEVMKFTMPNVKPGDVIDIKYTIRSSFISNIDEFQLQEKIPVDTYNMSFSAPEYFVYKMHQKGFLPFKVIRSSKNRKMRYSYNESSGTGSNSNWSVKSGKTIQDEISFKENVYSINETGIPSIKNEPLSGNLDNYIAGLKLELSYTSFPNGGVDYYATTWDDVCKTIYQSSNFGGELEKTGFLKNEMAAILGDAVSREEKIVAVFEFVKKKTAWNENYGVYAREGIKETFKKSVGNAGDINLLLVAMLREAGVNANPILISTVNHGIAVFPTLDGFNYVICGVEEQNNVILLDATGDNAPDILDRNLLNWQGRLIRKDGSSSWVPLIPSTPAVRNSILMYEIDTDQVVTGKMQKRFTGHFAANFRESYKNLTSDETRKQLEEYLGDSELNEVEIKYLDDVYKSVQYRSDFENTSSVEEIGDKLYLSPLLFLATEENIFKADTRELPIYFGYPQKGVTIVTIALPEGYKVESLPESISLTLGDDKGSYKFIISEITGKIQLSVDNSINQHIFLNSDYKNLKQFYELIVKKENEKIVLSKV
jgi:uncharacterized protein YfkK (UPF0435 family)